MKKNQDQLLYLLVVFNIVPHINDLPYWITVASLTFVFWKFISDHSRIPIPGRWGILSLTLLTGLGVFNEFGNVIGNESSTAILILMAGLKTFELRSYRDSMVLTYLCFFLLMSKLIASQTILMTVYLGLDVILILALMRSYHASFDARNPKKLFLRSALLIGVSAPIILTLFFLFPRFSSGFGTPKDSRGNVSGFSGEFKPGTISNLMLSEEPAFRAVFNSEVRLHSSQLYWRGLTLTESQGLNWSNPDKKVYISAPQIDEGDNLSSSKGKESLIDYEIFLEPHGEKYLFALDWPIAVERPGQRMQLLEQNVLKNFRYRRVVDTKLYYRAQSQINSAEVDWSSDAPLLASYTKVEDKSSPEAWALAQEFRKQNQSSAFIVKLILDHFAESGFSYTLSPPPVETIDQFLFQTRKGFCEHYAGSMATLLRWAGVPARVVIGYQGGTDSVLQNYLLIRQLDAHAWVEYFDQDKATWVRIDPTSVVAPDRIQLGSQRFLDRRGVGSALGQGAAFAMIDQFLGAAIKSQYFRLQLFIDQAEMTWSSFLLKYDFSYQQKIFKDLGAKSLTRLHLLAYLAIAVALFVLIAFAWTARSGVPLTPSQKLYRLLLRRLKSKGFEKQISEGPKDFFARINQLNPELGQSVEPLFAALMALRYGRPYALSISLKELEKQIKNS